MPGAVDLRGAAHDLLHEAVAAGLPGLRRALEHADRALPRHVSRELEGSLGCGDPENGFAWLRCPDCIGQHRLVPFSCKGRGFCPSCGGRRMAERAAFWVDRVFPRVAVRQWVLTVPWDRRLLLARRPDLAAGVLGAALDVVERFYRAGNRKARGGSVTATQRFGSALNLNLHFHCLVLDGAFARGPDGRLSFRRRTPSTKDVEQLVVRVADACERFLARHGFGRDDPTPDDDDDAQAVLQQASLGGLQAVGPRAGRRVRRVQLLGGREHALPPRCAACDGYTLHAGTSVKATDRDALERMARYVLRPPLAKERLERTPDGAVLVGMKRAWSDGTTALVFTPTELTEKLAALVPPPRANTVIYRGVLAGNAAWRKEVVPKRPELSEEEPARRAARKLTKTPRIHDPRPGWADLLERVFGKDGFACPRCGGPMTLRCVVEDPSTAARILSTLTPATGPP